MKIEKTKNVTIIPDFSIFGCQLQQNVSALLSLLNNNSANFLRNGFWEAVQTNRSRPSDLKQKLFSGVPKVSVELSSEIHIFSLLRVEGAKGLRNYLLLSRFCLNIAIFAHVSVDVDNLWPVIRPFCSSPASQAF